ncbi:hypothetical protein [Amycolatopsis sp. VC5-11]|uniref:hypothetical protein n=1 Tax=Amycolatopsis sp. VC5-11 TaxID=3120156 RepID=UPI00300863F1
MHAWIMTIGDLDKTGESPTPADAWRDVHDAAVAAVLDGHLDAIHLVVDGQRSTVQPGDTDRRSADTVALLDLLRSGKDVVVAAHRNPPTERED